MAGGRALGAEARGRLGAQCRVKAGSPVILGSQRLVWWRLAQHRHSRDGRNPAPHCNDTASASYNLGLLGKPTHCGHFGKSRRKRRVKFNFLVFFLPDFSPPIVLLILFWNGRVLPSHSGTVVGDHFAVTNYSLLEINEDLIAKSSFSVSHYVFRVDSQRWDYRIKIYEIWKPLRLLLCMDKT